MRDFLRRGYQTASSAAFAGLFYGAPLVLAYWFGAFDLPPPAVRGAVQAHSFEAAFLDVFEDGAEDVEGHEAEGTEAQDAKEADEDVAASPPAARRAGGARRSDLVATVGVGLVDATGSGTGEGGGDGDGIGDGSGDGTSVKPAGAKATHKRRRKCDDPHPQVRSAAADGVVEIDRALVDQYTANLESFMSLGFSRPHNEDGLKGWYISGFSCSSPVHKAGFRRGDVLLSVNGKNTRSWVGVFLLYQKLKNRDAFEIDVVRKGEPVTLRFRVIET